MVPCSVRPIVVRPVLPGGYRLASEPGAATTRDQLSNGLVAIALAPGDLEHGGVDAGVWPRPWLGCDVGAFERQPRVGGAAGGSDCVVDQSGELGWRATS